MDYAKNTGVSVEKSKVEIERTLVRYGAEQFVSGWAKDKAMIAFQMSGKQIKFLLPLPNPGDEEFKYTHARKYSRTNDGRLKAWEQACRQRWRALALCIKAKLEAVECGITTFEEEFLPHFVVPGSHGQTVGDLMIPQLEQSYLSGSPLPALIEFKG